MPKLRQTRSRQSDALTVAFISGHARLPYNMNQKDALFSINLFQ